MISQERKKEKKGKEELSYFCTFSHTFISSSPILHLCFKTGMISKTLCSFLRCNQRYPDQHSYLTEDGEYTLGRGTFFVGERKADILRDVRWIALNSILSLRRTLHPCHRDTSILPNDIRRTVAQGLIFGARGHGKSHTVNLNIT